MQPFFSQDLLFVLYMFILTYSIFYKFTSIKIIAIMKIKYSVICIFLLIIFLGCFTLLIEGKQKRHEKGKLIHGKYFGPLNNTIFPFPKEVQEQEVETGWISQPLDHFNKSDTRKWYQKFARNNTFFRPGGPACISISGESSMDPRWLLVGQTVNYCSELNGVLYMLEHRFYGSSTPTRDTTVENLSYLTVEQALEDIARFIEVVHYNENHKIGKVILFGGSYSGTLVAYFRQKYPHLADIAVASSAPLTWKFDFSEYNEVVGKVLKQYDDCYERVASGMKRMEEIISEAIASKYENPINDLLKPLKICGDLYVNKTLDVENFYSAISSVFGYYTQYNSIGGRLMEIKEVCEHTATNENEPKSDFQVVADLINLMYSELDYECFEFSNDDMCDYINKTSWNDPGVAYGVRLWMWQVCNELASFQTTNSPNQPFIGISTELFVYQCVCAFGESKLYSNTVQRHINSYGALQVSRSHVIYINGEYDPWSSLGVINQQQIPPFTNEDAHTSLNQNCVIVIKGASHCNDMQPDRIVDSNDLQQVRNETRYCIKNWIAT